jgi:hypothetical protein
VRALELRFQQPQYRDIHAVVFVGGLYNRSRLLPPGEIDREWSNAADHVAFPGHEYQPRETRRWWQWPFAVHQVTLRPCGTSPEFDLDILVSLPPSRKANTCVTHAGLQPCLGISVTRET